MIAAGLILILVVVIIIQAAGRQTDDRQASATPAQDDQSITYDNGDGVLDTDTAGAPGTDMPVTPDRAENTAGQAAALTEYVGTSKVAVETREGRTYYVSSDGRWTVEARTMQAVVNGGDVILRGVVADDTCGGVRGFTAKLEYPGNYLISVIMVPDFGQGATYTLDDARGIASGYPVFLKVESYFALALPGGASAPVQDSVDYTSAVVQSTPCVACHGLKMCQTCNGTVQYSSYGNPLEDCPSCNGTGDCPICGGTGYN